MATNNTKNNASQTLFRFVSLRNPQLTETKDKNLGFIHRPPVGLASFFDGLVNPNDSALLKFQSLERAVKSFDQTSYKSELFIEEGYLSEALRLGRKIAAKEPMSVADETTAKMLYNSSLIQDKVAEVWDNLIYQTVTQSNFYVKEALVHILKALHFGYVCDLAPIPELIKINGEDLKAKALEARVVLPMKFFGDGYEGESLNAGSDRHAFKVNASKIGEGIINGTQLPVAVREQLKADGEKISELSSLTYEKNALEQLRLDLEKTQKLYHKSQNKSYEAAYKQYTALHQTEIDEYREKQKEIDIKVDAGGLTQEEIDALYKSLGELSVPAFSFKYKNEINFEDLKANLADESFRLFVNIFTELTSGEKPEDGFDFSNIKIISDTQIQLGSVTVSISDLYDTYSEVFEKFDEELLLKSQLLYKKAPLQEQLYTNLGGILVPVANSTSNSIPRSYYLMATPKDSFYPGSSSYFTFFYQADNDSWAAASVKITAITDFGLFDESFSNIPVVDNKVTLPSFMVDKFGKYIRNIQIRIYFNNGTEAFLELSGVEVKQPYTGLLYTEEIKDPENPGEGGTTPTPGNFIPKHFGVKRLGIADYLKVEQSVHAYVPGEVSNIENVMASELRHKSSVARDYSEITDTTSESIETEKISDTTKTQRSEMQTEIAKELEKEQNITASTKFSYDTKVYKFEIGGTYANKTSQHDSTKQAVTKSQEITERAMERVLTKINTERVQKIIKEFTETNVHEFDNRGQASQQNPQHITGVYRWVDKKMKNQIYNYGKRTMFEFMIPEPARLHTLATATSKINTLKEPVDPRKAPSPKTMADAKSATRDLLTYWADIYGVKLTDIKEKDQQIESIHDEFNDSGNCIVVQRSLAIPANYVCKSVDVSYTATREKGSRNIEVTGDFTNGIGFHKYSVSEVFSLGGFNLSGNWVFKNSGYNIQTVDISLKMNLEIQPALFEAWKQENFDAIIKAYQTAYEEFLAKQKQLEADAKAEEASNKEKLGNFYREMESVILKHNCIAYLLQDYAALGQSFTNDALQMQDFSVILNDDLEQYTALAKFMEQAFEWSIMDYTFYPYYWASKKRWQEMYLSQSTDPLFRNFLQAGMARVIVTVKPGFEDAVQFFMSTGKIWNGGEVPVIGDPLYMSIVDELRQPAGDPQGKYWITRIPTTLTILQAKSVGLEVQDALPVFPEDDPKNCENPKDLETETSFSLMDKATLQAGEKPTTLPTTIVG
ncbi:hypothetical protein M2347_001520 [Chryseobacterium sp. H1D6B]|uniref:hypothetical protein n=1 Tax=Chryseobacterium sp. H1D6B TaxID=2940588 RepID=UPI0015C952A2|nr:hypothetical protein [Chryseobacterium sp. H1D6B]MDH6251793.1 hypothetical protein [Chryseobacterium sp. H1D6B]